MTGGHDDAASVETIDMTAKMQAPGTMRGALSFGAATRSDAGLLRALVIAAGIGWSVLFVASGSGTTCSCSATVRFFLCGRGPGCMGDPLAQHFGSLVRLSGLLWARRDLCRVDQKCARRDRGLRCAGFLGAVAGADRDLATDRSNGPRHFVYACLSTACL